MVIFTSLNGLGHAVVSPEGVAFFTNGNYRYFTMDALCDIPALVETYPSVVCCPNDIDGDPISIEYTDQGGDHFWNIGEIGTLIFNGEDNKAIVDLIAAHFGS